MSERKVLNKYYPPDFDPNKVPRNKVKKNYSFTIRTMAPFHMRCHACGEYIYKGRKFNSRHENVPDENYLGLRISRFYIRCPKCAAEIVFKTDIENQDYKMEAGATRCFENLLNARREEVLAAQREQEDLEKNPMKMVEMKAKSTLLEEEIQGSLKDLEELRTRQRVSEALLHEEMGKKQKEEDILKEEEEELLKRQKEMATRKAPIEKDYNLNLSKSFKPVATITKPTFSNSNETSKLLAKLSQSIKIKKKTDTEVNVSKIHNDVNNKEQDVSNKRLPSSSLVAYGSENDSNSDDSTEEVCYNKETKNSDQNANLENSSQKMIDSSSNHELKDENDEENDEDYSKPLKKKKVPTATLR